MRFSISLWIIRTPNHPVNPHECRAHATARLPRFRRISPAFHFRSRRFFAKNNGMTNTDDTAKAKSGADAAKCAPEKTPNQKQAKRSSREERLAEALRANLKRRKEQQRERKNAARENGQTDS